MAGVVRRSRFASDIQRGVFAGQVGAPRLLKLFGKYGIRTSFFVPGHSIETLPKEMKMVVDAGHEIGAHGYSHENPIAMTEQQERDVLNKSIDVIEGLCGKRPKGYVAPWWELSESTASWLLAEGFSYDHSQSYNDFSPFYARVGASWSNIDYAGSADDWMKPLVHGKEVDLVEFCGNWYMDDLPPMMFITQSPNSHGIVNLRDIEQIWNDQFDWVYREMDYAVLPITLHPDVSGRPQVLLMLERLIERWSGNDGVRFVTLADAAEDFRRRNPFGA